MSNNKYNENGHENVEHWNRYISGIQYNNRLKPNYYQQVDANIAMYNGDQWRNLKSSKLSQPVFNIIKRAIQFFVASITSNKAKVLYEPLAYSAQSTDQNELNHKGVADIATSEIENLFDKFKMDNRIKDALFDGAVLGDYVAHVYFDATKQPYGTAFEKVQGEICFELIDGTNIFFGNPNNPSTDVKVQPYIILSGREMTENLKREAKLYKQEKEQIDNITEDTNYGYEAGDASKIELTSDDSGKSQYIITYQYDYETKTIKATKCVQNAYIFKDVDTGLSYYPIAFANWEKQKGQYHGKSLVTDVIPNQIFINRMFAMVFYHLTMTAFPKAVYNADKVVSWSNEVGTAIGLRGLEPNESVRSVAGYLETGNMSAQIVQCLELAISYTKETLGVSDASLGNLSNPENYKAIAVTQEAGKVPLENIRANLYEWLEDVGKILLDMMGTYYGERPIVVSDSKGNKQLVMFDFTQLKNVFLSTKTEVGATTYFSEIASVDTLNNLLKGGYVDIIEYLDSLPSSYLANKQEITDSIKERQQLQAQQQAMANQMPPIPQ